MGVAYGSSSGSVEPVRVFGRMLATGSMDGVTSTSYIQMMPHTTAVKRGPLLPDQGRLIPTSSACTSGSQALGYAYESIRYGRQLLMVAGGAEELSAAGAAVFDTLFATSTRNDMPAVTPRPFDRERDGLVVGEGAATLVLEDYDHAVARGARIHAEIIGFATNSDGAHVTEPVASTMGESCGSPCRMQAFPLRRSATSAPHGTATEAATSQKAMPRPAFGRESRHQLDEELPGAYTGGLRRDRGLVGNRDAQERLVRADHQS